MGALASVAVLAAGVAVVHAQRTTPPPDPAKRKLERPLKAVVASSKGAKPTASEPDNPKVAPGKVKWHANLAAACAAAEKSGKPVLLFQMMGRLDHKFC